MWHFFNSHDVVYYNVKSTICNQQWSCDLGWSYIAVSIQALYEQNLAKFNKNIELFKRQGIYWQAEQL